MKTLEYVLENYESDTLDGRDLSRLASFLSVEQLTKIGYGLKDDVKPEQWIPKPWTHEAILEQLRLDVEFGFEKALSQRGISASLMYEVVRMWSWVLEDGLEDFENYSMYGLPLFKATAVKYGWENPIGEDSGSESKYDA